MRLYTHLFKWPYHIDLPALLSLTTVNFHCMTLAYYPQLFIFSSCSTLCCGATILALTLKPASPYTAASQSNQKPGHAGMRNASSKFCPTMQRAGTCHRHAQCRADWLLYHPAITRHQVHKKTCMPAYAPRRAQTHKKTAPVGAVFAS